jgi:hypothetical protein
LYYAFTPRIFCWMVENLIRISAERSYIPKKVLVPPNKWLHATSKHSRAASSHITLKPSLRTSLQFIIRSCLTSGVYQLVQICSKFLLKKVTSSNYETVLLPLLGPVTTVPHRDTCEPEFLCHIIWICKNKFLFPLSLSDWKLFMLLNKTVHTERSQLSNWYSLFLFWTFRVQVFAPETNVVSFTFSADLPHVCSDSAVK